MIVISVMPTNIRGRFIFEIYRENLFFYVKLREILIEKKNTKQIKILYK